MCDMLCVDHSNNLMKSILYRHHSNDQFNKLTNVHHSPYTIHARVKNITSSDANHSLCILKGHKLHTS
jgi:hypothetical protein